MVENNLKIEGKTSKNTENKLRITKHNLGFLSFFNDFLVLLDVLSKTASLTVSPKIIV